MQPPRVTALTAVQKLELSKLDTKKVQRELMGDDLDLDKLNVYLKSKILFDATSQVIDINVERTIDGASTLDLIINDYDRTLLRSGALNARLDIEIDGLWFRLVKVSRTAGEDTITLGFEQREIAVLRTYPTPDQPNNGVKFASRDNTTRAEFILNLIREVKEFKIPVIMPHLHQVQQIEKHVDTGIDWSKGGNLANTGSGLAPDATTGTTDAKGKFKNAKALTVKDAPMTKEQRNNANIILSVGKQMHVRRKLLVAAIATATVESELKNNPGGLGTSVGLFQQIDEGWGSYEDRHDPATASRSFYNHAIKYDNDNPTASIGQLCQGVQGSGYGDKYQPRAEEASRTVTAFGIPPGKNDGSTEGTAANANHMEWNPGGDNAYYYYRGIPPKQGSGTNWKREDNWTCIRRLAEEVDWRAFFISGVFYFLTDDDLYKMQPVATITESTKGVMGIGFDYDLGKKGATVDIPAMVGLWLAPPGAIIVLQQMGPLDGRWLVNSFSRSLFSSNADINLAKPTPKLPEPYGTNIPAEGLPTFTQGHGSDPIPSTYGGQTLSNGSRQAIVQVAQKALAIEQKWHYDYAHKWDAGIHAPRPMPDTLWSAAAHNAVDCSSFATLVYKEAGLPDPNGPSYNYNGQGSTYSLIKQGTFVTAPAPGDLVFYHGTMLAPGHVEVYVGGGKTIGIGGDEGVHEHDMNWTTPVAIKRYANA
jgi:hypothetical protein